MSDTFSFVQHPYAEPLRKLHDELQGLYKERARIEAQKAENDAEIAKRETAVRALTALVESTGQSIASTGGESPPPKVAPEQLAEIDYGAILRGIPKRGYGIVTRAVDTLLEAVPQGLSARELRDVLQANRFHLNGPDTETPVRSAIKNLRNQSKVLYEPESGRYRKIRPPVAAEGRIV